MEPHYADARVTVYAGDCLDVLRELDAASVDAVVTDPPYGLEFMGKEWDGADGFRRSMNPADAGRDSVFGRTSQTSPEYRTDSKATAGMSKVGIGERETPWPSHLGGLNPKCRNCQKWQRGGSPCNCDAPDFPNERLPRMHTFQQWCELWAAECLRVLKPGGHMLAFGGTRTWHRLACAIEDAGFEVRDNIAWLYGSGFPKSLDVSKAIDKRAEVNAETKRRTALVAEVIRTHRKAKGMERADVSLAVVGTPSGACWNWEHQQLPSVEMWPAIKRVLDIPDKFDGLIEGDRAQFVAAERAVIGERLTGIGTGRGSVAYIADSDNRDVTAPATDDARTWQGWGTALKPAFEPIVVARKPLTGTVAQNVLEHGAGALNIDGCRIGFASQADERESKDKNRHADFGTEPGGNAVYGDYSMIERKNYNPPGRWPANVVLDESQAAALDAMSGERHAGGHTATSDGAEGTATIGPTGLVSGRAIPGVNTYSDSGGASRFYFVSAPDGRIDPCHDGTQSPNSASIAGLSSGQSSTHDDSARSGAATSPSPAAARAENSTAPSTSGTASGSKPNDSSDTPATPTIASESSRESPLTKPSQMLSRARYAEQLAQTDTTTTTTNPSSSDGSADDTTSSTTSESRTHGAPALPIDDLPSRFTYTAKAPGTERVKLNGTAHPTVKPLDLMRWLVRLVTPPGGLVLDPFAGSGTTVEACILEGFRCVAIEREPDYLPLIMQRVNRRIDPVAAVKATAEDGGLFDLLGEGIA